uniref:hypothetical protein n=1 Tax=Psammodictyon constrictum TaxID=515483 RepID=UPI001EFA020E|nr:hypothetical protein MKU01_pgp034 [Psammodictyon constrictum]ULD16459.1 hypothetical protein [Psammodictyon constrictum]
MLQSDKFSNKLFFNDFNNIKKNSMSSYLAYSYSIGLTKEEQIKIDEKTKKSREEFSKGFVKGASFSLSAYTLYSLATSAAYAADGIVQPAPNSKPGMKPLGERPKGAFVGGASAICGAALQSRDFVLGAAFAFLLVIGGIIINRPN